MTVPRKTLIWDFSSVIHVVADKLCTYVIILGDFPHHFGVKESNTLVAPSIRDSILHYVQGDSGGKVIMLAANGRA
jgi:hypothetical protein